MTPTSISRPLFDRAIDGMRIPASCRAVMHTLWRMADWTTGQIRWSMSQSRIRYRAQLALSTVQWALRWLVRGTLLRIVDRDHTGTWLAFDLPDELRRRIGLPPHAVDELAADDELQREFERARMQMAAEDLAPACLEPQEPMAWVDDITPPEPEAPRRPGTIERVAAWARRAVGLAPQGAGCSSSKDCARTSGSRSDAASSPHLPFTGGINGGSLTSGSMIAGGHGAPSDANTAGPIATSARPVPFTGALGPEPTLLPRPRFSAPMTSGLVTEGQRDTTPARGGDPARIGGALGKLVVPPNPEDRERRLREREHGDRVPPKHDDMFGHELAGTLAKLCQGSAPHGVDGGQLEPPPERYVEPVEDARHVGALYDSREEAQEARWHRPPPEPSGSGDESPHRRVELAYRAEHYRIRGSDVGRLFSDHHAQIKQIIARHGVDGAIDLIRRCMRTARDGRGATLVQINARGKREFDDAEMRRLVAEGVDMSAEAQMARWPEEFKALMDRRFARAARREVDEELRREALEGKET